MSWWSQAFELPLAFGRFATLTNFCLKKHLEANKKSRQFSFRFLGVAETLQLGAWQERHVGRGQNRLERRRLLDAIAGCALASINTTETWKEVAGWLTYIQLFVPSLRVWKLCMWACQSLVMEFSFAQEFQTCVTFHPCFGHWACPVVYPHVSSVGCSVISPYWNILKSYASGTWLVQYPSIMIN